MAAPKVSQYLYASCGAMYFGPILRVGVDDGDHPSLDLAMTLADFNSEFLECERFGKEGKPETATVSTKLFVPGLPEDTPITLTNLQYRQVDKYPELIEVNMPGNGCYRCSCLFHLRDTKDE